MRGVLFAALWAVCAFAAFAGLPTAAQAQVTEASVIQQCKDKTALPAATWTYKVSFIGWTDVQWGVQNPYPGRNTGDIQVELMVSAAAVFECKPDLNGANPNNLASFAIPVTPRGVAYLQDMQACANNAGGQSVMTLAFIGAACPWAYSSGFPAVTLGNQTGPYPVTQTPAASGLCTIYHPTNFQPNLRHPVVVWGNGANVPHTMYLMLNNMPSYGFILVVTHELNAGTGAQMTACLDEFLAEAQNPQSKFYRKINPLKLAAVGHSQGGGGTIMVGRDPRISVTVPIEPNAYLQNPQRTDPASVGQQKGPMLLLSGGLDVTTPPQSHQLPIFNNTNVPVIWATDATAQHHTLDQMTRLAVTPWLRWHLMQDTAAANTFIGPCTLCTHPNFTVQKKGF